MWKLLHATQPVPHTQAALQCAGLSLLYLIETAIQSRGNTGLPDTKHAQRRARSRMRSSADEQYSSASNWYVYVMQGLLLTPFFWSNNGYKIMHAQHPSFQGWQQKVIFRRVPRKPRVETMCQIGTIHQAGEQAIAITARCAWSFPCLYTVIKISKSFQACTCVQ